jgi:hypothetical protein
MLTGLQNNGYLGTQIMSTDPKSQEKKIVRQFKAKLVKAEAIHKMIAEQMLEHSTSSKEWMDLMDKYMRATDDIAEIHKKIELCIKTGKPNGIDDDLSATIFGTHHFLAD